MNSEIIQILRKPKLVINEDLTVAVFDLAGAFIPTYIISKYILGLNSPILISAIGTIPIGYFAHKYFEIETPLNKYIDNYMTSRSQEPNTVAT